MYNKQIEILDGADIVQALSCPEGYLPCDGSIYNRDDFPVLSRICDDALIVTETVLEGSMVMPAGITEEEFRSYTSGKTGYNESWCVLLNGRMFVAYTLGRILYSDDLGITWFVSQLPANTETLAEYGITFKSNIISLSNDKMVYITPSKKLYYSVNKGTTWTLSSETRAVNHCVHTLENTFYLFPSFLMWINFNQKSGFFYKSDDGSVWTEHALPANSNYLVINSVTWLNIVDRATGLTYYLESGNSSINLNNWKFGGSIYGHAKGLDGKSRYNRNFWDVYDITTGKIVSVSESKDYKIPASYGASYTNEIFSPLDFNLVLLPLIFQRLDYLNDFTETTIETCFHDLIRTEKTLFINLTNGKLRFLDFPYKGFTYFNINISMEGQVKTSGSEYGMWGDGLFKSNAVVFWTEYNVDGYTYVGRIGKVEWDTTKFVTPSMVPKNGLNFYIKAV